MDNDPDKIIDQLMATARSDSMTVAVDDKPGRLAVRSAIDSFEQALQMYTGSERGEMDEINRQGLTEHFCDGVYIRELWIPAGVAMVSKLWRKPRTWIIAQGEVTFTTELGTQRVRGPITMPAPFGSKVALFAHTDTLWVAIARSDATCSEEAEDDLVANDYSDLTYAWDDPAQEGGL